MQISRIVLLACTPLIAVVLGGAIHGSASFEGKTWTEALEQVPCQNVAKDGKDLKINATLVVDGERFANPIITKEDLIEPVEKRCFPKH